MEKIPGSQFLEDMHPVDAHDKTSISDTATAMYFLLLFTQLSHDIR